MKCENCIHSESSAFTHNGFNYVVCTLTREVMKTDVVCNCYNRDLSEYDICYNCKYYIGGGDWGLFCSHKDMYHHLGKFSDEPCKRYEKMEDECEK